MKAASDLKATLRQSLVESGCLTASEADEAVDLAFHAVEQAVLKVLEIAEPAEGKVWLNAISIAYQLLPDRATHAFEALDAKVRERGLAVHEHVVA